MSVAGVVFSVAPAAAFTVQNVVQILAQLLCHCAMFCAGFCGIFNLSARAFSIDVFCRLWYFHIRSPTLACRTLMCGSPTLHLEQVVRPGGAFFFCGNCGNAQIYLCEAMWQISQLLYSRLQNLAIYSLRLSPRPNRKMFCVCSCSPSQTISFAPHS